MNVINLTVHIHLNISNIYTPVGEEILIYRDMHISPSQRSAFIRNTPISLTRQEFDLLYYLLINKGIVLTYEQIYRAIWNEEYDGSTYSTIKALIKRLRRKIAVIEGNHITIQNKWGVGYSLPVC